MDGISVQIFQIPKDDAVKVLHSICQQIWKTQQWSQEWKRSVFILIPKKGNAKECSNYHAIALISHADKVMPKFSKPGFSNTWTVNSLMFKLLLEKQRNQKSNCQHPLDHGKSKRVPEKHLFLLYWLCQSLWLCGSQKNCGKFWKRWEYQTTWLASWEICMQVKKQQLELDMEQQTDSK